MSRTKVPFSKAAILGLALSVSTSCAQIAAAAPQVIDTLKLGTSSKHELEQKARLRQSIKSASTALRQLHKSLEESCHILSTEVVIPKHVLNQHPYAQVVQSLRALEEANRAGAPLAALPIIGEEYQALRRQLAKARSLAVRNEILINQRLNAPQIFESDIDADGLKSLADMATDRLHRLVS
ncbi:hypothetical protein BK636_02260 [Pseudomonas chlororaphis]|uniref:hypothetical protein n=1 Tax=Pseudomonas chlororaphis TaxID=587753 RepID=UPI0008660514|nr:hypothetical protein [Pseudomonas chlororaphis]ROL94194.1 hypothetical protein BK636_02260 [Pseudomonas chlororaphis]BAV74167.1 hypothetical protein PCAU_1958 [Pseudomonas chlororaphis subsp. aurantiaca]